MQGPAIGVQPAATVAAACGGDSDPAETATANASNTTTENGEQAATTFDTALAGNKITGTMPQGGVVITTHHPPSSTTTPQPPRSGTPSPKAAPHPNTPPASSTTSLPSMMHS